MQIDREQLMRRKLPPGYARVVMPLVLSILMSGSYRQWLPLVT